ncbi:hypothetical protein [Streptomyces sp. NPDC048663]|uniref:hypothetical protein n=1 Tax=Streptomyces sp. NPDC048663 TaxID=3155638 RepID=UPI00343F3718
MNLSPGSIVSLTPAEPGTTIEFANYDDPWDTGTYTVVAWAVVIGSTTNGVATTTVVPAYLNGALHILSTYPDPEHSYRILLPAEPRPCAGRHLPPWCGGCGTPETDPNPSGMSGRWRLRDGEPCPDCHPGHVRTTTGE